MISRSISSSGSDGQRASGPCSRRDGTRRRSRAGVELRHRDVQRRRAGRRPAALHVALEHARPRTSVERPSPSTRSSSVVLPAPGALIRFTTRTPRAVEVGAVGLGDRRVRVERVLGDLHRWCDACAASSSTSIDSTSSSFPVTTSHVARRHARAAEVGNCQAPTRRRSARQTRRPGTSVCSSVAPSQTVSARDDLEVEVERVGHDLAQRADRHRHDRHRRPAAWRSTVSTTALASDSSCISPRDAASRRRSSTRLEHHFDRALDGALDRLRAGPSPSRRPSPARRRSPRPCRASRPPP